MISMEDCVGLCGLTEDEIAAIAEHEHIPETVASALGAYLMYSDKGVSTIRDMIRDDIREAMSHDRHQHAADLLATMRHFLSLHPLG